jgi:hypothetical protein
MSENLIYMEYMGSQHVFVPDNEIVKCIEKSSDITDIYLPGKFYNLSNNKKWLVYDPLLIGTELYLNIWRDWTYHDGSFEIKFVHKSADDDDLYAKIRDANKKEFLICINKLYIHYKNKETLDIIETLP